MTTDDDYRRYLEILGEDVVQHRLANRMPIGDKPENNPPYEFARNWLVEKAKARTKAESRRFWAGIFVGIVAAIAAIIAAIPVVKSWLG